MCYNLSSHEIILTTTSLDIFLKGECDLCVQSDVDPESKEAVTIGPDI